ncbi:MAG TPA: glycosyltransferase [Jatrophihabitantaceae bacterium]|nr:glycosyltransferase [Jatrophihabitantaceae bacterium]
MSAVIRVARVVGKLEPGGAQLALLRLSRELQRRHGVHTKLLAGDATPAGMDLARRYGLDAGVFRVSSTLHPTDNLQWQRSRRFAHWLTDKLAEAHLVHAHMVGAWWAVGQVIDPGTPFVATEHNEVNWARRKVSSLRPVATRIDRFYAMGPAASRFARAAGVRPDVLKQGRSPIEGLRSRPRLGLGSPRLTFAGRLSWDKGPDVLVEAISLLNRGDLFAYLLGDGPLRPLLTARIKERSLSDRVLLTGWVGNPGTYIAGSSVHVVPSREEAWSQSAVLALGLGVPVVGTRVDGLVTTLAHGRGITVSPDNPAALCAAIDDALAGRSPVDTRAAIGYARQFSAARVSDFYAAEYGELLAVEASRQASVGVGAEPIPSVRYRR